VAVGNDLTECLDIDIETIQGLVNVMIGFTATLPDLISLSFLPKLPQLPGSAIELFLGNLGGDVPAFSFEFGGQSFSFDGVDIESDLDIDAFSPGTLDAGMIKLVVGLVGIMVGLPKLFIDEDLKILKPTPPTPDVILDLVVKSLGLEVGELTIDADFIAKFGGCIGKTVVGIVLP